MEIWKDINGYEGLYQVSNIGNVRSIRKNNIKILKPRIGNHGYFYINLSKKGIVKTKTIPRLIAIEFIENPEKKECVNHKDGRKLNNNVFNLEWATYTENNRHAVEIGLFKTAHVIQFDLYGKFINEFYSVNHAERQTGVNSGGIWNVCNNKRKKAGGYFWTYKPT